MGLFQLRGVPARRQQKKSWLKEKKKKKERKVKKKEEGRGRRRERRKRNVLAPVTDMYKHRSSLWDNWIHVSRISLRPGFCPSLRDAFSMGFHSQIGVLLGVVKWL